MILAVGFTAQAALAAAFMGLPSTGTALRGAYRLSDGGLGLALGAVSLGIAVSDVAWGALTDRVGERRVLLTGLTATGTVLALMAALAVPVGDSVPPLPVLAGGLLLVGLLGGSVNGSSGRAVMAWFPDGQRGLAMGLRQAAVPAGGAVGSALLPWLAVRGPVPASGFQAVFGALALLCLLAAAAAHRWLRPPREEPADPRTATAPAPSACRSPLRSRPIWRLALSAGLLTLPQFAVLTFAGVFLDDVQHLSLGTAALAVVVVQAAGAVTRIAAGRWTDRHPGTRRRYVQVIGLATAAALAASAALVGSSPAAVLGALVAAGILANSWHGVAYAEIARLAGRERSGTALGLANTTVFSAGFLAPLTVPMLAATGWPVVWAAGAAAALLAVPLVPRRDYVRSGMTGAGN
ncbi:MFS transporter [Phaeacidiphilus oryzae]|uniref:MFS transporter n=1 Tax=Phaeacidiphilus oryzae TaxID=348818 RepID=UPI000691DD3E|nr:MFS transporter [Phaeacidiphilus oryzae]